MPPYRIVVTTPSWSLNGVNTFTARLAEGMRARGIETDLLITMPDTTDIAPMAIPTCFNVTRLKPRPPGKWPDRWAAVEEFIASRAPCIYLPNYDYRHSCVAARLPGGVGVVGIMHSDDPLHYDHFMRVGREWNAAIGVSRVITAKARELMPDYAGRWDTIPYGVEIPSEIPVKPFEPGAPLRMVYAGRLVTHQKRIFDLLAVMERLAASGVKAELAMIGGGEERAKFEKKAARLIRGGVIRMLGVIPNAQVMEEFTRSDVFILTSDFEGLSVSLLEAMGRGCVPVVTDIESGTPELITHEINGLRLPVGDIEAFAIRLAGLASDRTALASMSRKAFEAVDRGGYRTGDMIQRYSALFEQVMSDAASGEFVRPGGEMKPPSYARDFTKIEVGIWHVEQAFLKVGLRVPIWNIYSAIKHNTIGRAWWVYDWTRGRRKRPW